MRVATVISQDDIGAMTDAQAVVEEFVRRSKKRFPNGEHLPFDRWLTGGQDYAALAQACDKVLDSAALFLSVALALLEERRKAGVDSMSLGPERRE